MIETSLRLTEMLLMRIIRYLNLKMKMKNRNN
jgi:hypothetical protein